VVLNKKGVNKKLYSHKKKRNKGGKNHTKNVKPKMRGRILGSNVRKCKEKRRKNLYSYKNKRNT
jgi:hypothetical protein